MIWARINLSSKLQKRFFSMAEAKSYNVLVIGGGSGGIAFARRAAQYGASVAVFENSRLGGTCVNVGCVPKKVMFNTAHVAETLKDAQGYGFSVGEYKFDFAALKAKRDAYVKRLNGIYERNLDKASVDIVRATATFKDAKTLEAGGATYTAEHIVIACGGTPKIPNIPGAEFIHTSDDFFNKLEVLPKKAVVVGAGYIAVELGHVMQTLGVDVSLSFRHGSVLRTFDEDVQELTLKELEHAGVTLLPNTDFQKIEKAEDGTFTLTDKDGSTKEGFDYVLYAIGRNPVSKNLNTGDLGLEINKRGYVKSDELEQTAIPGIFSIGDVNGKIELTPVAVRAGRILADRLYGGKTAVMDYVNVPSVVFLDPPIGTIGLTEDQANKTYAGQKLTIYRSRFKNMYYSMTDRDSKTMFKIVCVGEDEKVVGLHLFGLGSDEMLQGFGVAIKMGATKADIDSVVAIHPTASEEVVTMKAPTRTYIAGERPRE